jgi:formate dehydrogenase assembly factor FdhD
MRVYLQFRAGHLDRILLSTGRVSSGMLLKAARMEVLCR